MDLKAKPDSGSPKAAALDIMRRLYGADGPAEVTLPEDDAYDVADPHYEDEREELPAILSENKTPKQRTFPCKIRVNGVGFTEPVLEISTSEHAVCLLLPAEGWDCDIPLSEDVQITVREKTLRVCYMGGLHRFPHSGYQAIWFVIMAEENKIDPASRPT